MNRYQVTVQERTRKHVGVVGIANPRDHAQVIAAAESVASPQPLRAGARVTVRDEHGRKVIVREFKV